jgi:hypothetical protein
VKLVLATPVRAADMQAASVSLGYAEMLIKIFRAYPDAKMFGGSLTFAADVVRGRNRIAARVLEEAGDATHVLWLDDDNYCDDISIIPAMMNLGVDVVGAPYTNKKPPLRWVHQSLPQGGQQQGDLLEVSGLGFGFTMVTTECLRKMAEAERHYTEYPSGLVVSNIFGQLFYHPGMEQRVDVPEHEQTLLSEDYSFCLRWRRMGGKVWLYTRGSIIHHAGVHGWNAREMAGGVVG